MKKKKKAGKKNSRPRPQPPLASTGTSSLNGKPYHIFAENIEPEAEAQFLSAMEQPFSVKGALMPDAHTGYTLPIGGVVATRDVILPAWVGYDIGCGMCALQTDFDPDALSYHIDSIYKEIYRRIPTGFSHHRHPVEWDYQELERTPVLERIFEKKGLLQLGTLGSGNHFIEIGMDETRRVWIVIHSGSRGLGHAVATHYMKLASGDGKAREGHFGFDVHAKNGVDYIRDMNFCLSFALENRKRMLETVHRIIEEHLSPTSRSRIEMQNLINRNHNHAELYEGLWIHRKGATQAHKGMMGVVPGNMRDGSFIVEGLGNPDSLWSSSHGAGRLLGRKKAKQRLSLDRFRETMTGVKAKVAPATLDESPFAYKDIFEVMNRQSTMVLIRHYIKPIINIKA